MIVKVCVLFACAAFCSSIVNASVHAEIVSLSARVKLAHSPSELPQLYLELSELNKRTDLSPMDVAILTAVKHDLDTTSALFEDHGLAIITTTTAPITDHSPVPAHLALGFAIFGTSLALILAGVVIWLLIKILHVKFSCPCIPFWRERRIFRTHVRRPRQQVRRPATTPAQGNYEQVPLNNVAPAAPAVPDAPVAPVVRIV